MARRTAAKPMSQLDDMSAVERMLYGNVEDDADLEAELLALQGEVDDEANDDDDEGLARAAPNASRKTTGAGPFRPQQRTNLGDIDRLARQISLEVAVQDDENDVSVENDDDLLAELQNVLGDDDESPPSVPKRPQAPVAQKPSSTTTTSAGPKSSDLVSLLSERLENYKAAHQAAKTEGDAAKVRRLDRGMKSLSDQLKTAKSGRQVNPDDIPPAVIVATKKQDQAMPTSPSTPNLIRDAAAPPKFPARTSDIGAVAPKLSNLRSRSEDATLKMLESRRDEYKSASLTAKQQGDKASALKYFKICKQFDQVIEAAESGQQVDLSNVPPSPGITSNAPPVMRQAPPMTKSSAPPAAEAAEDAAIEAVIDTKALAQACHAPPAPKSVMEALTQRLEKYKTSAEQANQEGDSSKARRMARIQKQYEDAIKAHKAGKPVDFDELPTPPGFAPIPVAGPQRTAVGNQQRVSVPTPSALNVAPNAGLRRSVQEPLTKEGPSPPKQSRQEQQLKFLVDRQHQFKLAALAAKKRGDLESAKKYLRQAMGFDQMIEASKNGLPIDISNVPTPPQSKTAPASLRPAVAIGQQRPEIGVTTAAGAKEGSVLVAGTREETYANLEHDLIRQVQVCDQNREYFTKLGDVTKVTMYEKMGMISKKDLESLRNGFRFGDPAPRFHYETKKFPSLQCCPDLGADDLELLIVRALLIKLPAGYEPKDADVFVKYEFPFPKETPQVGKSASVKGTNSPTFNQSVKLTINLKSRHFLLLVKRHGIKLEIYQKGSLFRSDKLLGAAEIKLAPLENKAEIHESLDLTEGRKPVGGKIEAKIRIREPIVNKSVEEVLEKWLVVDEFVRNPAKKKGLPRTDF